MSQWAWGSLRSNDQPRAVELCSRRDALRRALAAGGSAVLAACGGPEDPIGVVGRALSFGAAPAAARKDGPPGKAPSGDFYLDPALGDDGNDGTSPGEAWRTLGKLEAETLAGVVRAGHIVSIAPGSAFQRNEDTDGKFWFEMGISYTCPDPDRRALFVGSGDRPFGIRGHGTGLTNLRLQGGTLSVVHTDGTAPVQVSLTNVDCEHGQAIGFQQLSGAGVGADGVFVISGGSFSNNGTIGLNLTGARDSTVDGVTAWMNGTVGIRLQSSGPGCSIQNCLAMENGSNGIGVDIPRTGGGDELIQRNRVYRNAAVNDDTSGIKTFSRGTVLCYNEVHENGLGGTVNHGIQLERGSRDCLCYANLCYGNLTAGVSFAGSGQRIYHNTCHANDESGISTFSPSIVSCEVKNNLLVDNGAYSFRSHGSVALEGFVLDSNLHERSGGAAHVRYAGVDYASLAALRAATAQELNGVESGSRLNAGSLRIPPPSSAAGAGDPGVGILRDFDGNPYRDPPAIGAFEAPGSG